MPTPSEDTIQPTEVVNTASSSQNGFMSCPPEEQREPRAPLDERIERVDTPHPAAIDDRTISEDSASDLATRETMPDRDAPSRAQDVTENEQRPPKGEHIEDAGILVEPPSPVVASPDVPSDSDTRLAQSMSTAAISPATPPPQYLHFPELENNRVRHNLKTAQEEAVD